ncbi:hypothetical protein CAPTEDRAFT_215143 [Capitella teleta]|uniref:MCM3-like winged helix domain-containing protein n=1 Tax=Capitella teleta TaxID=283909 RepID=R7UB80_CAPTE|nr:hypothetical protein CAPTEDRAFT_215143 [Capitella teleta]|eukprot:ELU00507.1 hypothetical protein CAPTEDRAFT_215143 [Capitella teleta]
MLSAVNVAQCKHLRRLDEISRHSWYQAAETNLSLDDMRTRKSTPQSEKLQMEISTTGVEITPERLKVFKACLLKLFKQEHAQSLQLEQIQSYVNKEHAKEAFSSDELTAALDKMQDDNQVMVSDKVIFLI